jgi:hypothetical protein
MPEPPSRHDNETTPTTHHGDESVAITKHIDHPEVTHMNPT